MADDALTAAVAQAHEAHQYVPSGLRGVSRCSCGVQMHGMRHEHLAHLTEQVAQVVREHTAAKEAEARAEALDVAGSLLRRVADYWDGRPLTHHGDHIYADLVDVLHGIEADADHNRAEGLDAEPAPTRGDLTDGAP